jgi:hypothetical protein
MELEAKKEGIGKYIGGVQLVCTSGDSETRLELVHCSTCSQKCSYRLHCEEKIAVSDPCALTTVYKCPPLCDFLTGQFAIRLVSGDVRGGCARSPDRPSGRGAGARPPRLRLSDGFAVMQQLTSPHVGLDTARRTSSLRCSRGSCAGQSGGSFRPIARRPFTLTRHLYAAVA